MVPWHLRKQKKQESHSHLLLTHLPWGQSYNLRRTILISHPLFLKTIIRSSLDRCSPYSGRKGTSLSLKTQRRIWIQALLNFPQFITSRRLPFVQSYFSMIIHLVIKPEHKKTQIYLFLWVFVFLLRLPCHVKHIFYLRESVMNLAIREEKKSFLGLGL